MTYTLEIEKPARRTDPRLGRHYVWDSRNADYMIAPHPAPVTVLHKRHTRILNQGSLGSCTGNAMCGALGTDPVFTGLPTSDKLGLNEKLAVRIYAKATQLDGAPGVYPPDDTGSSGQAAAKAAQGFGYIHGYHNGRSVASLISALQSGPAIIGINWYEQFFHPTPQGYITTSAGDSLAGGHEVLVRGWDAASGDFTLDNSWGTGWGLKGSFKIDHLLMARLLSEQGTVVSFLA